MMSGINYCFPHADDFLFSAQSVEYRVQIGEHVLPGSVLCAVDLTPCNFVTRVLYRTEVGGIVVGLPCVSSRVPVRPGQHLCSVLVQSRLSPPVSLPAYQLEITEAEAEKGFCVFSGSGLCLCLELL